MIEIHINDNEITTISLGTKENNNLYNYDLDEKKMFIFCWNEEDFTSEVRYLMGKDKDGNIIYQEEILGL